jgi:hypothetical protein
MPYHEDHNVFFSGHPEALRAMPQTKNLMGSRSGYRVSSTPHQMKGWRHVSLVIFNWGLAYIKMYKAHP